MRAYAHLTCLKAYHQLMLMSIDLFDFILFFSKIRAGILLVAIFTPKKQMFRKLKKCCLLFYPVIYCLHENGVHKHAKNDM